MPDLTKENGYRASTADAYLRPASIFYPENLHVLTNAHVAKVSVQRKGEEKGVTCTKMYAKLLDIL